MKKTKTPVTSVEDTPMSQKIDYKEIRKLVSFMEEKKLTHFELEVEDIKVKISRVAGSATNTETVTKTPPPAASAGERILPVVEIQAQEAENNLHYITSPMVGTFYRAPDPTSPPFIEVGEEVKKNQTLCIIEAMKLMNEIESDAEGVIDKIFADNGKPVEYGQRLFAIRPLS